MIKGIIFDFDGVILETEYPQFKAWQECFQKYGCSLPLTEWAICIGTSDIFDPVANLEKKVGQNLDREDLINRQRSRATELIAQEPIMPGVVDLLQNSRRCGIKLAVASSSSRKWVQGHLDRLMILPFFNTIRTKDDVEKVKPEPDLFLSALRAMNLEKEEVIIFEDSPNGIQAARQAGIYCIAVPNRLTSFLDTSRADMQIASIGSISFDALLKVNEDHGDDHKSCLV